MIPGVKKCVESGDVKGLRYIFLDSLDVDPTFEKYKDDYDECKKIEGLFEPYEELTGFSLNQSEWDMDYWDNLKYDQKQNFSEKRFEHMKEVAKVVNAEKVERLLAERAAKQAKNEENNEQVILKEKTTESIETIKPQPIDLRSNQMINSIQSMQQDIPSKMLGNVNDNNINNIGTIPELEKARISESKREIELHNQMVEQERLENERKRAEKAKEIERENALAESQNQPKKVMGIVVALIIVLIVVVVLLLKVL